MTSFYSWRLIFLTFDGAAARRDARTTSWHHVARDRAAHVDATPAATMSTGASDHAHECRAGMLVPLGVLASARARRLVFKRPSSATARRVLAGALHGRTTTSCTRSHDVAGLGDAGRRSSRCCSASCSPRGSTSSIRAAAASARAQQPVLYLFLLNKWYFDELYDCIFVRPAMLARPLLWKGGDGAIIDGLGPDGIAAPRDRRHRARRRLQTGYLYHYAFAMLIGVAALRHLVRCSAGSCTDVGCRILSSHLPAAGRRGCSSCSLRGDDEVVRTQRRAASRSSTTVADLPAVARGLGRLRPSQPGFQFVERRRWLRRSASRYKHGRRRHLDAVRPADDLPDAVLHRWPQLGSIETASRNTWSPSWCSRR